MKKKPKIPKVVPQSRPQSEINVTPLVDVVLVLLIIFMVVTPLLEKSLAVRIPDAEVTALDEPPANQLVVVVSREGTLAINSQPIADADYVARLRSLLEPRKGADRLVFFVPDDRATYAKVVSALDGARAAGATILGMATQPMSAR